MGHQNYTLQRQQCLNVQPSRIIATLTGIQVIRVLWETWGCLDNEWPPLIDSYIMPTIYASCILSVLFMIVSVCATWSVYKNHFRSLNINWWIYYILTVFEFIICCAYLTILCVAKDRFVTGCIGQILAEDCIGECFSQCSRRWEESVIWAAITTIATLASNIAFAYVLYRVKTKHQLVAPAGDQSPAATTTTTTTLQPPYPSASYKTRNGAHLDEEGFQTIELK
ncbi:hypothetical protein VTP01DRAFT_464 [Rhizomucor pusillus]|uniref:uncharacterized protein n=1 Tax=Rhizomucor pusillus TaxID=4840 RepID=UPI003743F769